jgi:putative FmdB family regulatory protein
LPTYEYHCNACETNFDVTQSFHDDPLTTCPTCGFPVRKVFGNVGIVFKGSGFYKTDSRNGSKAASSEGGGNSPDNATKSSEPVGSEKKSATTNEGGTTSTPTQPKATETPSKSKNGDSSSGPKQKDK